MTENNYTYGGIGLGNLIAVIISYMNYHHLGYMIWHGLLGWLYIIYYLIRYGVGI